MKALRTILFLMLLCFGSRAYGSAMTTLTNFNAVYFLVDADPTAIPTNVVLLSGNITNWQKLSTNVTITINPSDTYVPYRIDASTFGDSWWYFITNGMGTDTNVFFGPGKSNILRRDGETLRYGSHWPVNSTVGINSEHSVGDAMSLLVNASRVATFWGATLSLPTSGVLQFMQSGNTYTGSGGVALRNEGNGIVGLNYFTSPTTFRIYGYTNAIGGGYSRLSFNQSMTNEPFVIDIQTSGDAGYSRAYSLRTNGAEVVSIGGAGIPTVSVNGTIAATNGYLHQFKPSFSTNYSIGTATNQQFFLLNGTNQLITLPPAAGVQGIIYRFSMTNGWGSFILTNAADGAKLRDGTSSSYTNIGINEVGILSDGSNWWLASKGKQIFPAASWSLNATISPVQDVITNIPFDQLEFNNSQGIALKTNALFAKPTQLWITNNGTYLITFSAVLKGSAGGSKLSVWLRKDGSDVARTRTDQGFSGATAQQCMTVNYFVSVGAPCFYELVAASHDATPPSIEYGAANPTGYTAPAMPAVIVTINRVSDTWP